MVGLSPESALAPFAPRDGAPGIEMAYFNLREGRFRQNNLHFVRALRFGNRHYVEDMYENRYQKEVASQVALAWRVLRKEWRNLWVLGCYFLIHVAGVLHRRGYTRASDVVRASVPLAMIDRAASALLRTRFTTRDDGARRRRHRRRQRGRPRSGREDARALEGHAGAARPRGLSGRDRLSCRAWRTHSRR